MPHALERRDHLLSEMGVLASFTCEALGVLKSVTDAVDEVER